MEASERQITVKALKRRRVLAAMWIVVILLSGGLIARYFARRAAGDVKDHATLLVDARRHLESRRATDSPSVSLGGGVTGVTHLTVTLTNARFQQLADQERAAAARATLDAYSEYGRLPQSIANVFVVLRIRSPDGSSERELGRYRFDPESLRTAWRTADRSP